MSDEVAATILAEVKALRAEVLALRPAAPYRSKPYRAKEAAEALDWSYSHTMRMIKARVLKTLPGKPYRITPAEIERHLAAK